MRKTIVALATATAVGLAGLTAAPQQAHAQWWVAPAIVGGVILGIGVGAAVASTYPYGYGYAYWPGYGYAYAPAYAYAPGVYAYSPAYAYAPRYRCWGGGCY